MGVTGGDDNQPRGQPLNWFRTSLSHSCQGQGRVSEQTFPSIPVLVWGGEWTNATAPPLWD